MRLYFYGLILIIRKFILRKNTGECVESFVKKMGVVYIKFAQILAMQNIGEIFTENDRIKLSKICDHINPISFKKIKKQIEKEYGSKLEDKFKKVYEEPVGSASISQVHKAILKNGGVVAIKVKRKDVAKKVERDIKQIRKLIHRFGRFFHLKNYLGSDAALNLYLEWITEEIDFNLEKKNIIEYHRFAKSVNGKIKGAKDIVIPKVYKKLCTKNILVMEFIFSKTINQTNLTQYNRKRISDSLNDYVQLSFYALFHDMPVTFHGDPHGGNIYIDKNGNIGFLDMGLIFTFSKEEVNFIRNLFLYAYTCNAEKLTELLMRESTQKNVDIISLKEEIEMQCRKLKTIPVTEFYMNMIFSFTKFNVEPPTMLYKMAKAFVSLYGMNNFLENKASTEKLLLNQIVDFYVNRSMNDVKEVMTKGISIFPNFLKTALEKGFAKSISDQVVSLCDLGKDINLSMNHFEEVLSLLNK